MRGLNGNGKIYIVNIKFLKRTETRATSHNDN